ncbi:symporter-like protein [Methylosinus sp. H3A]|uniref:symporter-like protein n=1 Tax=Methylosinus sp. H3A TaxID=2785786 RepID=UPI0018C31B73|nr:symporter-like protein [Methylosinus sp. H3A]MBG0808938.1 symporter-like protein [Methylosinus sp. H3A]
MRNSAEEENFEDRARLDGRIALAIATFASAYGLVALLDRVGAPERLVALVSPYFTVVALAALGFLLHSMRVSFYYAAGRAAPAAYAGFAQAALVAGLAAPFAARLTGAGSPLGVTLGLLLGVALIGAATGPMLRKTGAFSLSDLLAARFSRMEPRLGMIVVAALTSAIVALAGYQTAVDALVGFTGAGRPFAAFFIGAAILLIAGPGGVGGVLWSACAAAGVLIAGFALPQIALMLEGFPTPLPLVGDEAAWSEAARIIESWRLARPAPLALEITTALGLALGLATLAPALAPAVATKDAAAARRAGVAAMFWTLVAAALITATVASSALIVSHVVVGQTPERLPDAIYSASAHDLVQICGAKVDGPAQARAACLVRKLPPGAPLRPADISVRAEYLIGGLPQLAKLGAALTGLLASGIIAAGLALASASLHACAAAVGHDALYRLRAESALTSRRLAITRLALVGVTALGSATSAANAIDARTLVGIALALSAAGLVPLVGLALFARAQDRDAMIGQLAGLATMAVTLVFDQAPPDIEQLAWAGLCGAIAGLLAGSFSAEAFSQETPESRNFVDEILRGDGNVLREDKGV